MRYLLDTNIWIYYLKGRGERIAQKLAAHGVDQIVTCSVVQAELLYGAQKYGNREQRIARVEALLKPYTCLPFDETAARTYAMLRHSLEVAGSTIGPYDLQIAAIALVHGLTLVTANTSEFTRVSRLDVEDWASL